MVASTTKSYLLLTVALLLSQKVNAGEPCVCAFDGNDPEDCKVLGQFPTRGQQMLWEVASPTCMEFYEVNSATVDPGLLTEIWPNGPHENGDVDLLIAWLKQEEDSEDYTDHLSRTVKLLEMEDFFRPLYPSRKSPVVLKDRLTKRNKVYDCTVDQGEACWALVREFLKDTSISEDGQHEEVMDGIAEYLFGRVEQDRQHGQELVRAKICLDTNAIHAQADPSNVCGSLVAQIHDMKEVHEIQDCNVFALGPDQFMSVMVPKCNGGTFLDEASSTQDAPGGTEFSAPQDVFGDTESSPSQDAAGGTESSPSQKSSAVDAESPPSTNSAAFTAFAAQWALSFSASVLAIAFI